MPRPLIKHCRQCGTPVQYRIPDDGDTRERAVCPACGSDDAEVTSGRELHVESFDGTRAADAAGAESGGTKAQS